jgi:hypothetical protein
MEKEEREGGEGFLPDLLSLPVYLDRGNPHGWRRFWATAAQKARKERGSILRLLRFFAANGLGSEFGRA